MAEKNFAFVTGWPIEHSRSPIIHRYWLKKYGLEGDYVKHPAAPDDFASFVEDLPASHFKGGNVTIPHKEAAFRAVDCLEQDARKLGAVNTIWVDDQGKTHGTNTDGYGFLANLDDRCPNWNSKENLDRGAVVLGAGGAARAIIVALQNRGFKKITIANRTVERAQSLAQEFGEPCNALSIEEAATKCKDFRFIVNTTSVGMDGKGTPIELVGFSKETVVNDIVYTPLMTPLLKSAEELGMRSVDGLGMLLHQAVPGFELWFGVRPEVTEELRQAILDDLGEAA